MSEPLRIWLLHRSQDPLGGTPVEQLLEQLGDEDECVVSVVVIAADEERACHMAAWHPLADDPYEWLVGAKIRQIGVALPGMEEQIVMYESL